MATFLLFGAAVTASCGSTTATESARGSIPAPPAAPSASQAAPAPTLGAGPSRFTGTYFADDRPVQLAYLTLTQTGTAAVGFLIVATPDGQGSTTSRTLNLSGATDADAITLRDTSSGLQFAGRRTNEQLVLTFPAQSGAVGTLALSAGSQNAFNAALGSWQQDLMAAQRSREAAAAAAAAVAAKQKAVADADVVLGRALSSLASATRSLTGVSFVSTLNAYGKDWTTMQADYALMMKDAAVRPFTCFQRGTVRFDAGSVSFDLGSIKFDDGSFAFDLKDARSRLADTATGSQSARDALVALAAAVAANTTGTPVPTHTSGDFDAAIAAAQQQMDAVNARIQAAQASVSQYDAQAKDLNDAAQIFANGLSCSG